MRQLFLGLIERPDVRYLIVGGSTNLALFILYASLTSLGMGEINASSVGYATGILVTYLFNKGWSFRDDSSHHHTFVRYVVAYGAGFIVQISALNYLTFEIGLPHLLAQIIAMITAALSIFFLLKLFVFRSASD